MFLITTGTKNVYVLKDAFLYLSIPHYYYFYGR